jgi:hypothetical protein
MVRETENYRGCGKRILYHYNLQRTSDLCHAKVNYIWSTTGMGGSYSSVTVVLASLLAYFKIADCKTKHSELHSTKHSTILNSS